MSLRTATSALLLYLAASAAGADPVDRSFELLTVGMEVDAGGARVREAAAALYFTPTELATQLTGETLVALRKDLSIAPALAESYSISEDGKTYTFRLRSNAKFHNGRTVTAEDVAWVWRDFYLDPDNDWPCKSFYDGSGTVEARSNGAQIVEVEAVTPDTVVFRLARRSNVFLPRMADVTTVGTCLPVIFHRDSVDTKGKLTSIIGTGPYEIVERAGGVRLRRFAGYVPRREPRDGYAGARTAWARQIVLRPFHDRQAMLAALEDGIVDIVLDVKTPELKALDSAPGVSTHTTSTINFWNLLIQTEDALLADVRVRRAIAHAIDRESLVAEMTDGRQRANPSAISRNSYFHTEAHDIGHAYDPGLSRRLLDEAAYDGQAIELIANNDAYPEMYLIAIRLREMLREVGLNIVLRVIPWHEQLETHFRGGTFQLQSYGQSGRDHPVLVYGKFTGSKANLPRFQWDDEAALALVAAAQEAPDDATQQRIFDDLHARMIRDVPTLVLFNFEYHDASRSNIRGFESTPFMRPLLWGVWKE